MEEKWYLTHSINLGINLSTPKYMPFETNQNFKTFIKPPCWQSNSLNTDDILIDGRYIYYPTNNNFLLISKNRESLTELVRLWNKYTSENNTFEGLIV